MLVAPTEPLALRKGRQVSMRTENMGVDFLWSAAGAWWGVQRKAVGDLMASAEDGRLARELAQMKARISAGALSAWLVVEGVVNWTNEGAMLAGDRGFGRTWTRAQFEGLLWSVPSSGVWVTWTRNVEDTNRVLEMLEAWTEKEKHGTAEKRPGPVVAFGKAANRDWQVHFLQGLPPVGPETAKALLDAFGMPFRWKVTKEELLKVPGIGPERVKKMLEAVPMEPT